ncbi:rCG45297, isoform CRA_a [Rattus norvegicus]|uniref:RCG45297, isoform CRA_a n=1 Tax=Rattus norvegicus TaxID=10116 RepID=A6K991_RAT|nr:rCG45297, isoform CRA_a [Rattus norvegicus]
MIAGQVSKPLLSVRSEMNAELRGEDKAATSDSELNEPLLAPVESNDSEDTPSKLFVPPPTSSLILDLLPLHIRKEQAFK